MKANSLVIWRKKKHDKQVVMTDDHIKDIQPTMSPSSRDNNINIILMMDYCC